jgi:uncharacterized protein
MLSGHYWTLKSHLLGRLRPAALTPWRPWSMLVTDAELGPVRVSGCLHEVVGSRELLVIVHGLGGSSQSVYMRRAVEAAAACGMSCLRIDLRGSDLRGEDLYHAGLTSDLDAALETPELKDYSAVSVLGYSLGGHVALRYAADVQCPRVRSVVAVCSPLELALSARAFDEPTFSVYRQHVLSSLNAMYRAFAARHPEFAPRPAREIDALTRIQAWDAAVVVPRHRFASLQDYYESMSAARTITRINLPTLLVHAATDPMVPIETVRSALKSANPAIRRHESKQGGHVGFPANFSLGQDAPHGLEPQLLAWCRAPKV